MVIGWRQFILQKRLVKVHELNFQTKVEDIQNLIQQIEVERKERETQINERINKEVELISKIEVERNLREAQINDRIIKEAELMNYTTRSYRDSDYILKGSLYGLMGHIKTLTTALYALSKNLCAPDIRPNEVLEAIIGVCCATSAHIESDEKYQQKLKSISETNRIRMKSISDESNIRMQSIPKGSEKINIELESRKNEFDSEIKRLENEYKSAAESMDQEISVSNKQLDTALTQLQAAIERMINLRLRSTGA